MNCPSVSAISRFTGDDRRCRKSSRFVDTTVRCSCCKADSAGSRRSTFAKKESSIRSERPIHLGIPMGEGSDTQLGQE